MKKGYIKIGDAKFLIKVAITEEEQKTGLMHYPWPPPLTLFTFNNYQIRNFWMKSTPSPLDIIFCKDNKIVKIAYGKPFSKDYICSDVMCNLVLETPSGFCSRFKLNNGDILESHIFT